MVSFIDFGAEFGRNMLALPDDILLVIGDEQGGCEVVGQGFIVVGLHAGQAGPGVRDVLLHRLLVHGCVQLPIDLSHLERKERWE